MAGMTEKHTKKGTTFSYRGDLQECIDKTEKELREKENSTQWLFLKWQHDNAKKALDTYNRRVRDLKDFIRLGKEELEKQKAKEEAGNE